MNHSSAALNVTRLSWAGVQISAGNELLVIDAIEGRDGAVQGRIGTPQRPLLPITSDDRPIDVAVVTHLHLDHFDGLGRHFQGLCAGDRGQAISATATAR